MFFLYLFFLLGKVCSKLEFKVVLMLPYVLWMLLDASLPASLSCSGRPLQNRHQIKQNIILSNLRDLGARFKRKKVSSAVTSCSSSGTDFCLRLCKGKCSPRTLCIISTSSNERINSVQHLGFNNSKPHVVLCSTCWSNPRDCFSMWSIPPPPFHWYSL